MLAPSRVVEIVSDRLQDSPEPLHVFWCRVEDDSRSRFAEDLRSVRGDLALVPVIVRSPVFIDPNAILSDLNLILGENKAEIVALKLKARQSVAVVMLARGDFKLSQTGSLIQLPDWFPGLGGTEIYVRVRDLLIDVEGLRFNAPEARAEDLAAHLHAIELSLLVRLEAVFTTEAARIDSLWTSIAELRKATRDRATLGACLADYRAHIDGVVDARAYRPSLKAKSSVLSDLLALIQRSTPDQLVGLAKSLGAALQVPDSIESRLPMMAILLRPTSAITGAVRFCHSLLASAYGGYQFLNATAHASEYPLVSAAFLYLNSRDLRLSLQHATEQLERLQEAT